MQTDNDTTAGADAIMIGLAIAAAIIVAWLLL